MDLNKATRDFRERKCQCAKCLAEQNNEPCDCETARADRALGDNESKDGTSCGHRSAAPSPGADKDDSNSSGKMRITYGATTFGRKSSVNEPIKQTMSSLSKRRIGCQGLEYDEIGATGRDTLGSAISMRAALLKSNKGGRCPRDMTCEVDCGLDTGCGKNCRTKLTGKEMAGVRICKNEMVNTMVSFLLEGVGILVFFAVCTITFWVALGYYMAQMVVNLKKADRNVHVAISIVLGMLMLMFAITMVTHGQRLTHQRSKSSGKSLASHLPGHRVVAQRHKPKAMPMALPRMKPKLAAKMTRRYTDCQGRAIYNTARRNAVVIEMKQPPTWLVWLNDYLTTS